MSGYVLIANTGVLYCGGITFAQNRWDSLGKNRSAPAESHGWHRTIFNDMRYRWRDIPALVRTPLGRKQACHGLLVRTTPVFVLGATLYRRLFIRKTNITAVVGSFGKTTTTRCLLSCLGVPAHKKVGGNSGISLAANILRIRPAAKHAVIEVGVARRGQMLRSVTMVRPDIAVVTSIGSEHNRSFGNLEVARDEKAHMVRALDRTGLAVLNGDDPNVLWMMGQTKAAVKTFGFGADNHFRASDVKLNWPTGTYFKIHAGNDTFNVLSPFFGRHMIYPVLAAAVVADHRGLNLNHCFERLTGLKPSGGRLEPVPLDNGAIVLRDDFKCAAETIVAALDLVNEIPAKRKIVVQGEVNEPYGNQDRIYNEVGERIGQIASKAFFLCSSKSFKRYARGAKSSGMSKDCLYNAGTNGLSDLIELIRLELEPGDVLLVKGRNAQRLERLLFALQGRRVNCDLGVCDAKSTSCDSCPMLGQGWSGKKIVF